MAPTQEKESRRGLSNVALKQTMAVTGIVFVGFVVVHLFGNLKVFAGADAFNHYAAWLREVGYPLLPRESVLWGLRVVLLVSLIAHVWASVVVRLRARRARGRHRRRLKGYRPRVAGGMLLGGVAILAFILFHISDLTLGGPGAVETFRHPDVQVHAYENLVASFSRPWAAACYAIAMLVIAIHVEHGWRTLLQDLGATGQRFRRAWVLVGGAVALAILVGNASIPLLVLTGVIA